MSRQAARWLMNERVKAILITALKLSPEERAELAQTLLDNIEADSARVDQLMAEDSSGRAAEETLPQPTSDVLAKYLDI
jgi:acyl-CoA reductase-like NAD-dependent aldehyde dehydrogenase